MSRKNLVGTYSIPKLLQQAIEKENQQDDIPTSQLKQSLENDYNKQAYKITDKLKNGDKSYKERMKMIDMEQKPKRRKRWDVTPEEREIILREEMAQNKTEAPDLEKDHTENSELQQYVPPTALVAPKLVKAPDVEGLAFYNDADDKYFGQLEVLKKKKHPTEADKKDITIMELLLKVRNGNQVSRKKSLRGLTDSAKQLGPEALFKHILPLLVENSLEDQDRHVLVKLLGRLLFKLSDEVKPFTQQMLAAISPLLIHEDQTLRLEARELISSLSKAVGLAKILSTMRPDISNPDEYVRNIASRVLAVVTSSLGVINVLPFLKAVIKSKKSWETRHTGIKIIQQFCLQLGSGNGAAILPYLLQIIELIIPCVSDEMLQIRSISAITISQLAETSNPYGIEYFEPALEPLWAGIKRHRGRILATFLKCLGSIIPLMAHDANYEEYSNYYTREVVNVISREFNSQDDEMRSSILKVLQKLPLSKQLIRNYDKEIYMPFLRSFWNRRTASDTRLLYRLVVNTTTELASRLDFLMLIERIIVYTRDDNEQLRRMAVETIGKIVTVKPQELLGLDSKLEEQLVDGMLFAFQEQKTFNMVYINGLVIVCKAMDIRLTPHVNSILSTILYQIKNKSPDLRRQAALLLAGIAPVVNNCTVGETGTLQKLILILYESLGEVYPDVLAGILQALNSCLDTFDSESLSSLDNPSIPQLVPSLSPILKNRQEKVQEACIQVVGLIAKKTPEMINVREWMRICFDLLDTLKSPVKRIRIAANATFGEIARTIGPQDVLTMLLNNLRVQQRQLRVSTAVAIGIVADICAPFTVLPAIMNEYRIPDNNVQNGVLKAMTFLFEYIGGNMTKDYLYAMTTLLDDALTDRDQVHRQTAATVVKHIALNCEGWVTCSQIDVFVHLMNLLMPNVFETSPHVINRILEAIDSLKNVIGYGRYMNYIWAGLFHPARKVRSPYWKLYNMAYVQLSDAIVPYYPKLEDIDNHGIEEFDVFI